MEKITSHQRVQQITELLARAKRPHRAAFTHLGSFRTSLDGGREVADRTHQDVCRSGTQSAPYAILRRQLFAQIALKGKNYGLKEEIQAFVYSTGAQVIQELDNDQLASLHAWLTRGIEAMETACDSAFVPPAR